MPNIVSFIIDNMINLKQKFMCRNEHFKNELVYNFLSYCLFYYKIKNKFV